MKLAIIIILTLIIIVAIVTMIYINNYNKLLYYKKRVEYAESVILEELNARLELVNKTKSIIKKNTKMDLDIYETLEKAKDSLSMDYEKELTNAIQTIYLVMTDYPKLEEKKEFKKIIRELEESDTKIDAAKSYYNDNTQILNDMVKSFPSSIIAIFTKTKVKPFYEAKKIFKEEEQKEEEITE